jgi:hypothetical protein
VRRAKKVSGAWAVGIALLATQAGSAEIYRCADDDAGTPRFTSDPHGCPGAQLVPLDPDRLVKPSAAPPADTSSAAPSAAIDTARLADFLPTAPRGWEPTHEAVAVERDPSLRAQGLIASVSRHYGRARGAVTEMCSIELWSFARADQALAAHAALDRPESWKQVSGTRLVLARGVRLERRVGTRHGLVPGCRELAESVDGRARTTPRGSASTR